MESLINIRTMDNIVNNSNNSSGRGLTTETINIDELLYYNTSDLNNKDENDYSALPPFLIKWLKQMDIEIMEKKIKKLEKSKIYFSHKK